MSRDWKKLLSDPGPDGHIVQLYNDDDFYCEAISHFAAEGLVRGESIILVATGPNWVNISARMEGKGFSTSELFDRGQLTLLDANDTLPKFMKSGMPDGSVFKPLAAETIKKARCGGKFDRVRWWGEMVNVLYVEGNGKASHQLEQFFDETAHEQTVAIFCSFFMDQYDPAIYDHAFGNVCHTHSHVIPTRNYDVHRNAVNEAITDVIGPIQGKLLRSLVNYSAKDTSGMPPSQAVLLWVRETMPDSFASVLHKAKLYDSRSDVGHS
jgi:hypothetical protein